MLKSLFGDTKLKLGAFIPHLQWVEVKYPLNIFFTYQLSQNILNLQVTLMMEEERKENQSEELESLTLSRNSQETSHNGSALPVSVQEKLKA